MAYRTVEEEKRISDEIEALMRKAQLKALVKRAGPPPRPYIVDSSGRVRRRTEADTQQVGITKDEYADDRKDVAAYVAAEKAAGQQRQKIKAAEELAKSPIVKASYVFSPQEWFGMGVLSEWGVSALTGKDWKKRREELIVPYATELLETKMTPAQMAVSAGLFAGGKATLMAAPGGTFGKVTAKASEFSMKAMYAGTLGLQYGETLKKPTAEKVARSFVYTAPAMFGGVSRVLKAKTPLGRKIEMKKAMQTMTKPEQIAFKKAMTASKAVEGASPTVKPLNLKSHPKLTAKSAEILETQLKSSSDVVGGSVAQKAQMKSKITPGDVDIFSSKPIKSGTALHKKYLAAGIKSKLVISKKGETMEAAKIYIKGKKVIEFHTQAWRKDFPFTKADVKTPQGIRLVSLTEQVSRKAYGAYSGKRAKDIPHLRKGIGELFYTRKSELLDSSFLKGFRLSRLEISKGKYYDFEPLTSYSFFGRSMKGVVGGVSKPLQSMEFKSIIPKTRIKVAAPYKPLKSSYKSPYRPYSSYKAPKAPYRPYSSYKAPKAPYRPYDKVKESTYKISDPLKPVKPVKSGYDPYKPSDPYRPVKSGYDPYKPVKSGYDSYYPYTGGIVGIKSRIKRPIVPDYSIPWEKKKKKRGKKPKSIFRKTRYTPSLMGSLNMVDPLKAAPKGMLTGLKIRPKVNIKKKRRR